MKATKITYQVYGFEHIAYAPINEWTLQELTELVHQISNTGLIIGTSNVEISEGDFETLHISKMETWVNDFREIEKKPPP